MSTASESSTPLLPESNEPVKITSLSGTVFNVSTTIIGAGIISIPLTIKVLGIIPAFVLIVFIGCLANKSVEFLLKFTFPGESTTYSGLMKESFGRTGSIAVQLCVIVTNLGCLIVFLIIIGDVLTGNQSEGVIHVGVLQKWFGNHWWNSRAFTLFFTVVFIMLPLVMFRRVESLAFSSGISTVLAIVFAGITSISAIIAISEGKAYNPRLLPQFDDISSFFRLFTVVPFLVTGFTFHFNVHPIAFELRKPSDIFLPIRISLVLCGAIYFTMGVFGYILFGDSITDDVLVNFDRSSNSPIVSLLNDVVRLSYAIQIVLVFPLLNFFLRATIDELVFPHKRPLAKDNTRFMSISLVLLVICYLAAITIPSVWYFFQFIGSTSIVCIAFVFPGAIALRDVHGISTSSDKMIAGTMIVLAVGTSITSISTSLYTLIMTKT